MSLQNLIVQWQRSGRRMGLANARSQCASGRCFGASPGKTTMQTARAPLLDW